MRFTYRLFGLALLLGPITLGCLPLPGFQPYNSGYSSYYGGAPAMPYAASKSRMASDTRTHNHIESNLDPLGPPYGKKQYAPSSSCIQQRISEHKIDCAVEMERRSPSSEAECQRLCIDSMLKNCHAFQFEPIGMVCQLFDEASVTRLFPLSSGAAGSSLGSSLLEIPGNPFKADDPISAADSNGFRTKHRRQKRQSFSSGVPLRSDAFNAPGIQFTSPLPQNNPLGDPLAGLASLFKMPAMPASLPTLPDISPMMFGAKGQCEPNLQSALGTVVVIINPECTTSSTLFSAPQPSPPVFLGGVEPFSKNRASMITPFSSANSMDSMAMSGMTNGMTDMLMGPDCFGGSRARIQMIDGIALVEDRAIAKVQLDSADACLQLCRGNAHLDGTRFSRPCKSAIFDRATGRCAIAGDAISPNGELNYVPNPDSVYFEKFCVPENELPNGCDDVVTRIPQHTLDSRASGTGAVVTTKTQVECIRKCITAQRSLGFECASASFFFDWTTENCYLSRFTRMSRPDIYVPERKQLVDYMELAPCMRRAWQHDEVPNAPWSVWSDCDEAMTRVRRRNCSSCNPKVETAPCVSQKDFKNDFSKIVTELEKEPKRIAGTLEAAKRLKPVGMQAPDQASLFGEQDYGHQDEVSFFGPPNKSPPDNFPTPKFAHGALKSEGAELGAKSGTFFASSDSKSSFSGAIPGSGCDPRSKCCPRSTDLKTMVRGCSVGIRTLADGRSVPCLTDECQ